MASKISSMKIMFSEMQSYKISDYRRRVDEVFPLLGHPEAAKTHIDPDFLCSVETARGL
jgi:hypothetical protein